MIMKSLWWASALSLVCVTSVVGQTTTTTTDQLRATTRVVVGDMTFDQVLKVVGLPSVSGGASSALGVDSSGNVRQDSGTTISTAGLWTWAQKGTFTSGVTGPFTVSGGSAADTALGFTNVRSYINTTPRVALEQSGVPQIILDNNSGTFRVIRLDATGGTGTTFPMTMDTNISVAPYGRSIVPTTAYGTSLGSITLPFDSLWVGSLFAQTLVAIDEIGTVGNDWLIGSTNVLDAPLTTSATTAIFRYNNFSNGDFAILKTLGRKEFIKITSSATAVNIMPDSNMEGGADTNYQMSTGDTATYTTAKSFRGDKAILLTHGGSTTLEMAYAGITAASSTAYTFCGYFRRDDGGTPVVGDITVQARGSTPVALTMEPSTYDGWFRGCASFTSGTSGDTRLPYLVWSIASGASVHDWYGDAFQVEAGSTVRPYSQFRSSYTIARNQEGSVANDWAPGDAAFDLGATAGYGWLQCYALFGLKSTSEVGPACVANVRTGTTYNAWAPRAAWGQLNGLYDYASSKFGFAAGDSSATWVAMDDTNGFRVMSSATQKFRAYADGHLSLSEGAVTIDDQGMRIDLTTPPSSFNLSKSYAFSPISGGGRAAYHTDLLTTGVRYSYIDNQIASGSAYDAGVILSAIGRTAGGGAVNAQLTLEAGGNFLSDLGRIDMSGGSSFITSVGATFGTSSARWPTAYLTNLNIGSGTVTINGVASGDTGGIVVCPAGQAVKSFNVRQGIAISMSCGIP